MKSGFILSIDQGTTNTKALLLDTEGAIAAQGSRPLKTCSPRPGWVEQDPEEIWQSVADATSECLASQPAEEVRAIGIANQRETVILWEALSGRPMAPAIVWQCRRSTEICDRLHKDGLEPTLRAKSGLAVDPLFSASKIAWMLDHIPGARPRAEHGELRCGTVDSWLIWKLTDGREHICDRSNAARTQLFNLKTLEWDEELLGIFRIPRVLLPTVVDSSGMLGSASALPALRRETPIASALGDSHAALAGHGIFHAGSVKCTYGTGSSLMTLVSALPDAAPEISSTIAWSLQRRPQYALEGNITMTGSAVEWCGNFLGLGRPVEDLVRLAGSVSSSEGVRFVPAMCGLAAPYWNSAARGLILGLERGSTAAHLAYAVLESIAFQVRDVFEAMLPAAGDGLRELHADGGATRNDALMQMQADILGRPVLRSNTAELSAVGAAYLAGAAAGLWSAPREMSVMNSPTDRFEPKIDDARRAERYCAWKRAIAAALGPGA